MSVCLLKLDEVCRRSARKTTAVYQRVKDELFPPPIKLTARSSAWLESEVDAVNAAVVAGASDEELRTLVRELVARRASLKPRISSTQPQAA